MKIIAHRGNIYGPDPLTENTIGQINHVLNQSLFDIEIDVWKIDNEVYIGHDGPVTLLDDAKTFLDNPRFWIHAKNLEALSYCMVSLSKPQIFSHDTDPVVLTYPSGHLWVYPGKPINKNCVIVLPEKTKTAYKISDFITAYGVCTDYPYEYQNIYETYQKKSNLHFDASSFS